MLARNAMLTRYYVTVGLLMMFSTGACAEEERACEPVIQLGSYQLQLDQFSRSCLGPQESLLPDMFLNDRYATQVGSLTRRTQFYVDQGGCIASIQIRTDDYPSAAQLYLEGNGLVESEGVVHGEVTIQLRQFEVEPGKMFDFSIDTRSHPPSCETTARATLIRLPDPPDAGSGAP
jgi:hypothetical protein